jgi:hypothetical protein
MKKGVLLLLVAMVAGMTAFCVMRWHKGEGHSHHSGVALDAMPELAWLRTELKLSDEQFAKVKELHAAYRPKCVEMCRRISEAHERIETLASANHVITPDYRAALKEHADIHLECQEAMLKHLYETAGTLREDQAKRYLEAVLPFALDFSHSESGKLHAR